MTMTDAEIVANYRQAKDKRAQIGILADLNDTDAATIMDILREAGESVPRARLDSDKMEELYRKGLTDKELAAAMGCTAGGVSGWRSRRGLPPNNGREVKIELETVPSAGVPEACRQIEAILAALPAGSSEASRAAACELCRCLLWDAVGRGGIGHASNGSVRTDPP